MSAGKRFRTAVEARDLEAMSACLADDVKFYSPVAFKPFESREVVTAVLGFVMENFEEFRYVDELGEGPSHMLRFRARIGEREVEGVDLLEENADGLVERFTVMLRPLSALTAMGEAMAAAFESAGGKPGAKAPSG
ncbi:MAG: nuclear transport factor 2 family protein [Solirubrobacterales bacterium]